MIKKYQEETQKLDELKYDYDMLKFEMKLKQLSLKYSDEYTKYKTIKEKEERAIIETQDLERQLLQLKNKLRIQRLKSEISRLEIEYEQ